MGLLQENSLILPFFKSSCLFWGFCISRLIWSILRRTKIVVNFILFNVCTEYFFLQCTRIELLRINKVCFFFSPKNGGKYTRCMRSKTWNFHKGINAYNIPENQNYSTFCKVNPIFVTVLLGHELCPNRWNYVPWIMSQCYELWQNFLQISCKIFIFIFNTLSSKS